MTYEENKRVYNNAVRNYREALEQRRRNLAHARTRAFPYMYNNPQVVSTVIRLANAYRRREDAYYKLMYTMSLILKEHNFNRPATIAQARELTNAVVHWAPGGRGAEKLRLKYTRGFFPRPQSETRRRPERSVSRRTKSLNFNKSLK